MNDAAEKMPEETEEAAVVSFSEEDHLEHRRMVEAMLFASTTPLGSDDLAQRLPEGAAVTQHIADIEAQFDGHGVVLIEVAGKWMFRTAPDLAFLLRREVEEQRKLSRAATETLAIIAYHQPVTRAEIEDMRGVSISKGTLDLLMEAGWIRPKGRRRTPGRPVTYGTSDEFLVHFGLANIDDLPGFEELKAAGLLDTIDTALTKLGGNFSGDEDDGQLDLEELIEDDEAIHSPEDPDA